MNDFETTVSILYLLLVIGAHLVGLAFLIRAIWRKSTRRTERNTFNQTSVSSARPNNQSSVSNRIYNSPRNAVANSTQIGPVNYYANARHNQQDTWFQFEYKKVNGVWLVYILRMPSFNGRNESASITHRYSDGNRYWICYDPQPNNLKDAQIISRVWADRELEYIATGTLFEAQRWD